MTPQRWLSSLLIFSFLFSPPFVRPVEEQGRAQVQAQVSSVYLPLVAYTRPLVRAWPDTTTSILPFDDQLEMGGMSEAQWQFVATHFAGTQKVTSDVARHLRQFNPGFLVLHYRLGQALGHSFPIDCQPSGGFLKIIKGDQWVEEWPGDSVVQEAWFYHYGLPSARVFNCDYGHYLMDLDNPGWRTWWSGEVIQQLEQNEDDGVFADNFNIPSYGFIWDQALPEGDTAFEEEWALRQHAFTDYIRWRFNGIWRWVPNVGAWITKDDPSDYSNADGVMIEGFADGGYGGYYPLKDWELQLNRVLPLAKAGKIILAQTYPDPKDINERIFVLGTFLLVKGSQTYLNLEANTAPEWYPEYTINLGSPLDPLPTSISEYYDAGTGVYARHYTNGLALVNPSNEQRTVILDPGYYQVVPEGGGLVPADGVAPGVLSITKSQVTQVILQPNQAAVFYNHP